MNNRFTLIFSGLLIGILLSIGGVKKVKAQSYCTPVYGPVACIAGMDISNLTLAGATVTLNNTALCSANGYGDYTNLNHPDLIQGQFYSISVSTSYAIPDFCNVRIWIDYNNDGTFSNSEEIATTNGNGLALTGTSTFSFTVPFSATAGMRRMRARLVYAGAGAIDPCTIENFGEAEDYQIEIVSASTGCSGQPTAGNIMGPSTVSVCANADLTLIDTGATDAGGMIYQWQQRAPAGSGTWTNISGATGFTLNIVGSTLPASSEYRFIATCSNSSLSDTSNTVVATLNQVPTACYCIPEATNSTRYIDSFSTSNAAQNVVNNGSGFSVNGYGDFSSDSVQQYIGQDFDFSAVFKGGNYGIKVWVDWNQDGIFDTSEVAFQSTSFSNALLGTVNIPSTALLGATRIRVGISSMLLSGPVAPCETNYAFGEFEDYTLVVLDQTPCSATPNAGTIPNTAAVCSGGSFHLEAIGATSPVSVSGLVGQWQFRSPAGTGVWTDVAGATLPSTTVLMPGAPVDVRFIYSCGSNSDTSNIMTTTIIPTSECYCVPEGINPNRFVNNFSTTLGIQNISNSNSGFSANGYEVFTVDTLIQKRGHPVQFNTDIKGGNAGIKIWVDWNQDGEFNGPDELVHQSTSLDTNHTGNFTIPHTSVGGVTRMRIGTNRSNSIGPATPCETNYDKGEFEDYIVYVQACDTPLVNLGSDTTICEGVSLTLYPGNTDSGISKLWNDFSTAASLVVNDAGTYSVKVFDFYGCANYDTIIVSVSPIPSADSIAVTWIGNDAYNFSASGVQNASTYHWDFGDGATSTGIAPNHTFANTGTYEVSLIITNDCGSDTLSTAITYTTGINQIKLGKEKFQVYPNPTRDHLTLKNSSDYKMSSVTIYNVLGQSVYMDQAQTPVQHQLNVGNFSSGIYTIWVTFEEGRWMSKQFEVVK